MVDDNVLLDHAFYMGLYLAVLDRRDLSLVESGFYNTSIVPDFHLDDYQPDKHGEFEVIDDFKVARAMA